MKPISQPAEQAQPDQISYGVDSLELFQTYTRETYRAAFGSEAPPWDPSRPPKAWFDSTVFDATAQALTYLVVARDSDGRGILQPLTLSPAEALAIVKIRLRQVEFKANLFRLWRGCSLREVSVNLRFLVASHIRPWAKSTDADKISQWQKT